MDLLRLLVRLPLLVLHGIFWLLSFIIGDLSWSAPAVFTEILACRDEVGKRVHLFA